MEFFCGTQPTPKITSFALISCVFVYIEKLLTFFYSPLFQNVVQEVEEEGKYAIDSPGVLQSIEIPPEDYNLKDNESRSIIQPASTIQPSFQELLKVLITWINDELVEERIIVTNIEEDLYDGQVLQKLWEKLTGQKANVPEVTQSAEGQRQKLQIVLNSVNHVRIRFKRM